jgi:hypothetical protein
VLLVMAEAAQRRGVRVEPIRLVDALRPLREATATTKLCRLIVNPGAEQRRNEFDKPLRRLICFNVMVGLARKTRKTRCVPFSVYPFRSRRSHGLRLNPVKFRGKLTYRQFARPALAPDLESRGGSARSEHLPDQRVTDLEPTRRARTAVQVLSQLTPRRANHSTRDWSHWLAQGD